MRIDGIKTPQSAFLSIEKDMDNITKAIFKNERLCKLLHYTDPKLNPYSQPDLTSGEKASLFGQSIKITPKIKIDPDVKNYVFITFDDFTPNSSNPQFRDNAIYFDIVCHNEQWQWKDSGFALRPIRIAAELDSMFNNEKFSGIGRLEFKCASLKNYTDEYAGIGLMYEAIHGDDDKIPMPGNDEQERVFAQYFDEEDSDE